MSDNMLRWLLVPVYLIGLLGLQAVGLFVLDALNVISLDVRWPL